MSEKIKALAIVKESIALVLYEKWRFLGLALAPLVPMVAIMGFNSITLPFSVVAFIFGFLGIMLLMLFIGTITFHLAVTTLQGEGRVMPERVWPTMGKVLVRALLIWLVTIGVMLSALIPAGIIIAMSPEGGLSAVQLAFIIVVAFVYVIMQYSLMIRLGIMIPAASVGHVLPVKQAWHMTRGYTWKMFLSVLIAALPIMVISLIAELGITSPNPASAAAIGAGGVVQLLFAALVGVYTMACNSVWYVRLKERDEVARGGAGGALAGGGGINA